MPLSREQKENLVEIYQQDLADAPHVFLVDFSGVSVPEATDLRNRLREAGGGYVVIKNRIARRAVEGRSLAELQERFQGPTAAAFSADDAVSIAKALTEFRKEVPAIEFKGGMVDGQPVEAADIEAIAALPSREELIAKLLFLMKSPVTRLVRTLGEMPRRFVVVMEQIRQAKEA